MSRWSALVVSMCLLASVALLSGCSSYQLRGRVVRGDASFIQIVDKDDPRLSQGTGIAAAQVSLTLDPERINREMIGTAVTDGSGEFTIPVDEVGAGFLEYDIGIRASGKGLVSAWTFTRLPPGRKRVLITLQRGQDLEGTDEVFEERENLWEEVERYR